MACAPLWTPANLEHPHTAPATGRAAVQALGENGGVTSLQAPWVFVPGTEGKLANNEKRCHIKTAAVHSDYFALLPFLGRSICHIRRSCLGHTS